MTTIVKSSNSDMPIPTSYVSDWIAQSHGNYQTKSNEYYPTPGSITTTWLEQAKLRLDNATLPICTNPLTKSMNDDEFQRKLSHVRTLLDIRKQRGCRHQLSKTVSSSLINIPLDGALLQNQTNNLTIVGDSSSTSTSPPLFSSPSLTNENNFQFHDESFSSSNSPDIYNIYHHSASTALPCLMEESPSDSGLSDRTKTTNHEDSNDLTTKNAAIIDLSKPLSKEEMLAIMQILRELWKKQFDCEMPDIKTALCSPVTTFKRIGLTSNKLNKNVQYQSTPALNKLNNELDDIKFKLNKFSSENQKHSLSKIKSNELGNNHLNVDDYQFYEQQSGLISLDTPLTEEDVERIQMKKDRLLCRQMHRHEEQLIKSNERKVETSERLDEYRLFERYLSQKRCYDDQRRANILQSYIEQKNFQVDPLSSNGCRNKLKRKPSIASLMSMDDSMSFTSSVNLFQKPKRNQSYFDLMSPSVTASTTASRSKMNRAASICNINRHYDSMTSLNSKASIPTNLFGGSLINLSKIQTPKAFSLNLLDDKLNESQLSTSMLSLTGSRLIRNGSILTTKSNKQTIINALKQVALAGSANEKQRDIIIEEIESSDARHFILLFRDHRLQFRAIYTYVHETDIIEKLHGTGPNTITETMVDKWFKYNSGNKRFNSIPIKHFSIQCDAIIIYNEFWQKKAMNNTDK